MVFTFIRKSNTIMQMKKLYRDEQSIMYDNYLKRYTYILISISGRPDRDRRMEGGEEEIPQDEQTGLKISHPVGLPADRGNKPPGLLLCL